MVGGVEPNVYSVFHPRKPRRELYTRGLFAILAGSCVETISECSTYRSKKGLCRSYVKG